MYARHPKDGRAFWRALVFWAWLTSFIFGFAASDWFHAPNCPEQLALRAAHHHGATRDDATRGSAISQLEPQVLQPNAVCPTCLLQLDAQGIPVQTEFLPAPLAATPILARSPHTCALARPLLYNARGPPVWFT